MRKLTFDSIMSFYDKHNRSVYRRIVEAQRNGTLSPFVGAGLSVPFGYRQWGGVLTELVDNITNDSQKSLVLTQIKEGKYEEAAGIILKEYPFMLDQLPDIVSPDILTKCSEEKKRSSAAWVLPYLFRRELVMTTNFDRVLEECYLTHTHKPIPTVTPVNRDRLIQLQLNQELCLLKLHGDIGKEAVSIDDLVFTEDQYKEHYAEGSPLVSVLERRFTNRRMLFLGCSLSSDRTMKVLGQVVKTQKGIRHFAILGCKKSEISTKMKELQALGILPIFYDDSNHDAVRVILENLLYETDPDAYQQLDDELRRFVAPVKRDDVLMYNAGRIKYIGRTAELAALERFCSSVVTNEWWAVTGPGGMGKSRLIYEFTKQKQKEGWQIHWFSQCQDKQLTKLQLPVENTIVVLDDIQSNILAAGEWLKDIRTHRRINRLRVLLIERDGTDYESADWLRVLRSGSPYSDPLAQWCHNKTFLHLKPLTDDDLKSIMESCGKALGKSIDPDALLTALNRADGKLRRPLYALAIAEAACNGADPLHWDPERVLDEMLNRELAFHYESLKYLLKEQPTASLQEELELLMAQSCIWGSLSLDSVTEKTFPYLNRCMELRSPEEFFRCLGLLHTEDGNPVLRMNCPDLIKEHLVLRLAFDQGTLELLPEGWRTESERLDFLGRLWSNYPHRLQDKTSFMDRFFSIPPRPDLTVRRYGELLWSLIGMFSLRLPAKRSLKLLEAMYRECPDNEHIVNCYATGLYNLTVFQPPDRRAHTVELLRDLYNKHPDWHEIATQYADGLFNLACIQPEKDMAITVSHLKNLYNSHPDWQTVAIQCAKGLHLLSLDQNDADASANVKEITQILFAHPEIIPAFKKWMDTILSIFPDDSPRYQPLRELVGDGHA